MYKKNHSPSEKPSTVEQNGKKVSNPHQFTRVQHVIPQAHLREWVNSDGKLSISGLDKPIKPEDAFFVDRLWSQWAESRMLGKNETNYFTQSKLIKKGKPITEHTHITAYFCMLHARMVVTHKERPHYASHMVKLIHISSKAELEELEVSNAKSHVHVIMGGDDDSQSISRQLVASHMQMDFVNCMRHFEATKWEIFRLKSGRFIMPDFFQNLLQTNRLILPISPQIVAICSNLKHELEKSGLLTEEIINSILKSGIKNHYVK